MHQATPTYRWLWGKHPTHGIELKGSRYKHGRQHGKNNPSVCMCIPNHTCAQAHACEYQTELQVLL